MSLRIGIVGLGEAGNLGDDLILIATAQAIAGAIDGVEIHFISHGRPVDWDKIFRALAFECRLVRNVPSRDFPFSRHDRDLLAHCDAIVLGGGGLFETSHHPQRPYYWLHFLPTASSPTPVIAVGLGLGPLTDAWTRRLRDMGSPFDECFVRDDESLALSTNDLHWPAMRCRDFVDAEFLDQLLCPSNARPRRYPKRTLGVALRAWPGLQVGPVAAHINRIAATLDAEEVRFFVLEANANGSDISYAQAVMARVATTYKLMHLYEPNDVLDFVTSMARCDAAISMKLHSSAIWAAASVPIYPISYAPKTAAFFDVPYTGLEVFSTTREPRPEGGVPRAQYVLKAWLARAEVGELVSSARSMPTLAQRLQYQTQAFATNVWRRLISGFGS